MANGELVEAEQVHDADLREHRAEQIGPLRGMQPAGEAEAYGAHDIANYCCISCRLSLQSDLCVS